MYCKICGECGHEWVFCVNHTCDEDRIRPRVPSTPPAPKLGCGAKTGECKMISLSSKPMIDNTTTPTAPTRRGISGFNVVLSVTALGALAFGYSQWQTQQSQLALLTQMVQQLTTNGQASSGEGATVRAPADANNVTLMAAGGTDQITAPAPEPMAAPLTSAQSLSAMIAVAAGANPASAETVRLPQPTAPVAQITQIAAPSTTADKLRALTAQASSAAIDDEQARRAHRMETLATIGAGVQQLVDAVVAGDYDIHTNYKDDTFAGRIHFAFVGHEKDQTDLEQFLAKAAADGLIAHSSSVVGSDGTINGHIMLFDLVERAMENGTPEEQRAGQKLRAEAARMLAETVTVGEPANSAGEKFYVVERGDSLAYIALQFYGNTNDYAKIFDANRDLIANPEKINVGQRLRIPNV